MVKRCNVFPEYRLLFTTLISYSGPNLATDNNSIIFPNLKATIFCLLESIFFSLLMARAATILIIY